MKIESQSKKGLRTTLSIIVDKGIIQKKLNERLLELQSEVNLRGFRPGKVPSEVIKRQYGKAIYGEVVDKILKETSTKAIEEKKIKAIGQPKIDLKTFGEGKDLNYSLQVDSLPEIKLKSFDQFKATSFEIKLEKKIIDEKIKEIAKNNKNFIDKKDGEKAFKKDLVVFDYSATVDEKKFEGSEGKGVQIELGKDLFLKGFDDQLVGVKKNDKKIVVVNLPENHPKKELANKETKFECTIINVKKSEETKIDDKFAKNMGAKDLKDLEKLIEQQVSSQYKQALDSITKKEILDQVEKSHEIDLPKNLVETELATITKSLKKEDLEKHKSSNEKLAKSRIKLGLLLNEIGEKNNIKVTDDEVKSEINKQVKGMPGQESMVIDYYKKNPSATQSLKGAIYEEKIITSIKSKIKIVKKNVSTEEAEKILKNLNKPVIKEKKSKEDKISSKSKVKNKKLVKGNK